MWQLCVNFGCRWLFQLLLPTSIPECFVRVSRSQSRIIYRSNALCSCNNEERLCLPQSASQIDAGFIDDYSSWHKWCDPVVLYHPTTPVLSSITVTYDANACPAASTACLQMFYSRSQCQLTGQIDDITAQSSCLCAPAVLSLEYTCSVLGNVSCLQIPAHLESMTGYSYCSNIRQVLTVPQSLVSSEPSSLTFDKARLGTSESLTEPQTASLGPGTTNRETYYTPPSTTASQAPTNFPSGPSATSPSSANNAPSGAVIHFLLQDAGLTVAIILLWTVLAT